LYKIIILIERISNYAAERGNIDILKWGSVHSRYFNFNEIFWLAGEHNKSEIIKWAKSTNLL